MSRLILAALGLFLFTMPVAAAVDCSAAQPNTGNEQWLINFATGSAAIDATARRRLDQAAARIKGRFASEVCLFGQASRVGNAQANQRLSQQRIAAVQAELARRGVSRDVLGSRAVGAAASSAGQRPDASGERSVAIIVIR
jgi:outer membrane protein OmpA-like peptidoglycan-associated protein